MAALAEACALAGRGGARPGRPLRRCHDARPATRACCAPGSRSRASIRSTRPRTSYRPLFALDLIAKDLAARADARRRARRRRRRSPAAALGAYRRRSARGYGGLDYSAVYLTARTGASGAAAPPARRFPEARAARVRRCASLERVRARPGVRRRLVLDCLLEADRRGVHTHGLLRLPAYCAQVRGGRDRRRTRRRSSSRESGPTALVDGRLAFGARQRRVRHRRRRRAARASTGSARPRCGTGRTSAARRTTRSGSPRQRARRPRRLQHARGDGALRRRREPARQQPALDRGPVRRWPRAARARHGPVDRVAGADQARRARRARPIPAGWALDARRQPDHRRGRRARGSAPPARRSQGIAGSRSPSRPLTAALAGAEISPRLVNTGLTGARRRCGSPAAAARATW